MCRGQLQSGVEPCVSISLQTDLCRLSLYVFIESCPGCGFKHPPLKQIDSRLDEIHAKPICVHFISASQGLCL